MSYHFHMLRRRRAAAALEEVAEAAQTVTDAPVVDESVKAEAEPTVPQEPVKKASKSRRKGDV